MITPAAYRARARRTHAREAVRRAGLPLLRKTVDRARELLDEHADHRGRSRLVPELLLRERRGRT